MSTIHSLFEAQAEQMPDAIAAIIENQFITYGELNKKANRLAHYLRKLGVKPDTTIAVCLERSIDLLISILGILKAGAAYVPLDMSHPKERLLFILKDINAPVLFTVSNLKEIFNDYEGSLVLLDKSEKSINSYPADNLNELGTDKNLAYIIYTSGSTGLPKGVLIEHRSVVNYCSWFSNYSGVKTGQRIDFSSNFVFDMAVTTSIVSLMLGLTIVICNDKIKKNLKRYLNYLQSNDINIIKMTPSYLKVLASEVKNNLIALPHLHTLILGGENLHAIDCKSWLDVYPEHILYNEYGPTETTVGVSCFKITSSNLPKLEVNAPIGLADTNVNFYLLDDNAKPIQNGETGELYIGGICLARGYLNQPILTEEKFIKNPFSNDENDRLYRTGDLCRQTPNGVFEYFGRIDQQVKINGFRIQLEEIEHCLVAHPDIEDAIVLVKENLLHEKQLVAYYIPTNSNISSGTNHFRQYLQQRLPNYMIPSAFVWVDSFPRTANDKLDPLSLPAPQFSRAQHYIAPRTQMEKTLAEIWSKILAVTPIGIKDNFFELGGHSLTAARIISKIEKIFEKEVTLEDLYLAPTIKEFATVIRQTKITNKTNIDKKDHKQSSIIPLNDFQFMFWIGNLVEKEIKRLNIVGRKRLKGQLDVGTLQAAFEALFKKHELFSYYTKKISPAQKICKKSPFQIEESDIATLSKASSEATLLNSFNDLVNYSLWQKEKPSIIAKLFYLPGHEIELQICMPHMISDHYSIDIFFSELSNFYLLCKSNANIQNPVIDQEVFKTFLSKEQDGLDAKIEKNINFWQKYLKDADFYTFPKEFVIKDVNTKDFYYSTYIELPEQGLNHLQQYCAELHVSLMDGLCATLGLALANCCSQNQKKNKSIFMGVVKSIRDNSLYDDKIGCFLRLDALKVDVRGKPTIASLCKQVHKSTMETMAYQPCSSMAKLAAVGSLAWNSKGFPQKILNKCIYLYTKLFPSLRLNHFLLSLYLRLISYWKKEDFFVYINLLPNFLPSEFRKESHLFDLELNYTKLHKYDVSKINDVLEICFLRDESNHKPYLVISANLKPAVRELIAEEMIRIIQHETVFIEEKNAAIA